MKRIAYYFRCGKKLSAVTCHYCVMIRSWLCCVAGLHIIGVPQYWALGISPYEQQTCVSGAFVRLYWCLYYACVHLYRFVMSTVSRHTCLSYSTSSFPHPSPAPPIPSSPPPPPARSPPNVLSIYPPIDHTPLPSPLPSLLVSILKSC